MLQIRSHLTQPQAAAAEDGIGIIRVISSSIKRTTRKKGSVSKKQNKGFPRCNKAKASVSAITRLNGAAAGIIGRSLEQQQTGLSRWAFPGPTKMEAKRSAGAAVGAILLWWCFNVMTVVSNKWIFQILEFKFPLTVTVIHLVVSSVGAFISIKFLRLKPLIHVNSVDRVQRILPMSLVFCLNIVLGNVSLKYIPVSFMQTVKSLTPATTLILQWLVWGKVFDSRVWLSLLPVVGGIMLASLTELSFNAVGFLAAFFGCLVTSTKTILAERLLHGFNFDSINTVYYMAPNAAAVLCMVAPFVEGAGVWKWIQEQESLISPLFILVSSGAVAFCLNFSIFYVIQSTTALTFNVAGNLKVAVAIAVSWFVFRNPISFLNGVGCSITLLGCTIYGYVSQMVSAQSQKQEELPVTKL